MTTRSDFEATLGAWLDAEAPQVAPSGLVESVLAVTSQSRPLPAWRAMFSAAPMRSPAHVLVGSPTLRLVRMVVVVIVLATLVLAGGLIGSGAFRLIDRDPVSPDLTVTADGYALDFDATERVEWEAEDLGGPGDHYVARSSDRPLPDTFIGDLTIERPDHVFERGGSESIAVPSDLVAWLASHPSLDVLGTGTLQLGGRQATVVDALPVFPPRDVPPETWRSWYTHYPQLLPTLFLDGAWQYRFVLVDLEDGGWLVATCGTLRDRWAEVAQACGEVLATWEWVEP